MTAYKDMSYRMSLKIHFLHSQISFFPANLGDASDEHRERHHQEMMKMENRYQGRFSSHMMGDYCWFLVRDIEKQHRRKSDSKYLN